VAEAAVRAQSEVREAPSRLFDMLRSIGPGIVVTGSVIGAGELINTPQRASTFGFTILWAVVLSCIIKYWLQVELGRYCLATNLTTIQALNTLPGPRWRKTHIIPLLYMFGFILSMATLAGILTATAGLLRSVCLDLFPNGTILAGLRFWAVVITLATALMLYRGGYESLERFITLLVAGFSLSVILCLILIQMSPQRIALADIASGLTFRVPPGGEYYIISLMGALGTGANELFMYPYWILESGYAKSVGPKEAITTESWYGRARGWLRVMKIDVAVATAIATIVTMGYYLVGAAILFGAEIGGTDVVKDVSRMFTQTYGTWSYLVFMLGGFCTLYSTLVVMAAATGRMGADLTSSLGFIDWQDERARRRTIRIFTMTFLTGWLLVSLVMTQPQNYIAFGQFAIGIINTPILLIGIVMMAFRVEKRLRMGKAAAFLLLLSAAVFILVLVRTAPDTMARISEVLSGLANR
jgi:manganese transport protein